jgi:hypothetical protein
MGPVRVKGRAVVREKIMNEIILRTWLAIKEMPLFLRILAIISPAGILMILGCLVPLGGYGVNGRIVTYGEFWRSGGAFIGIFNNSGANHHFGWNNSSMEMDSSSVCRLLLVRLCF